MNSLDSRRKISKIQADYYAWLERHPYAEQYQISTHDFDFLLSTVEKAEMNGMMKAIHDVIKERERKYEQALKDAHDLIKQAVERINEVISQ